jgi:uncharacterized protein
MQDIIFQKSDHLEQLCRKHKVLELYVFGSVVSNSFNEKSDIDFLVYFDANIPLLEYSDNYFELKFALEDLFGRKIDLVEGHALRNKYFIQEVNGTKIKIYGHQSIEVFT